MIAAMSNIIQKAYWYEIGSRPTVQIMSTIWRPPKSNHIRLGSIRCTPDFNHLGVDVTITVFLATVTF